MKTLIIASIVLFVISVESAQPSSSRRSDNKNSNLAVMLAYKPKSEIRTKDDSEKSWTTYRIPDDKNKSEDDELNKKLMELLTEQRLAKLFKDKATVKRNIESSSDEIIDSNESFIDDAKIVHVNEEKGDKKACYKNTYKNVLNAFEDALKSQILNYKKCVCQKKQPKTTTTTTTTTTTEEIPIDENNNLSQRSFGSDEDEAFHIGNEKELATALDHPNDIICFHKQYAFMLNKLLKQIPCGDNSTIVEPSNLDEYSGKENKRHERQNRNNNHMLNIQSDESESIELNVSEITQKLTAKETSENYRPIKDNKPNSVAELKEQILAVLKEHLNVKKGEEKKVQKKISTTTPKGVINDEEDSDEDDGGDELKQQILASLKEHLNLKDLKQDQKKMTTTSTTTPKAIIANEKDSDDIDSEEEFLAKLRQLFQTLEESDDESFPVPTKSINESTTSMPTRKSLKKSNGKNNIIETPKEAKQRKSKDEHKRKSRNSKHNAVNESSDESTELSIKLKNAKLEKEHSKSKENLREATTSNSKKSATSNTISESKKKSYRTAARTIAKNRAGNEKYSPEEKEKSLQNSSAPDDNRLANDLAKAISDFAREHLKV